MLTRRTVLAGTGIGAAALWFGLGRPTIAAGSFAVTHTEAEWRKLLTPEQYTVLREAGTETPYTSPLLHEERKGTFACAGCNQPAFASTTKFDSGTGWPSFWATLGDAGRRWTAASVPSVTPRSARCGRRFIARAAVAIRGMCSATGRCLPACAIA